MERRRDWNKMITRMKEGCKEEVRHKDRKRKNQRMEGKTQIVEPGIIRQISDMTGHTHKISSHTSFNLNVCVLDLKQIHKLNKSTFFFLLRYERYPFNNFFPRHFPPYINAAVYLLSFL